MTRFPVLVVGILVSLASYGQEINRSRKLSSQDSVLLAHFWESFKNAVNTNNKIKLAMLCEFPFYCRPCIDDTTIKNNNHVTIKVTRNLFITSQYKLFLSKPVKDEVNKNSTFDSHIFIPIFNDANQGQQTGFKFSYTIMAPSKNSEGIQGFIFLKKVERKFKITGIDTVP